MSRHGTAVAILGLVAIVSLLERARPSEPATAGMTVPTSESIGAASPAAPPGLAEALARPAGAAFAHLGDVQAGPRSGTMAEVSIAVDRFDPNRLVAAAMNISDGRIWTLASADGGRSWRHASIPIAADARFHADPMVSFDSRGRVHLIHIPVTGQSTTRGIDTNYSDDGGRSWSRSLRISSQTNDDKTALVADDDPDSPTRDHVFAAWKLPQGGVFFTRSTDRGRSFEPVRRISGLAISGLDLAVSQAGEVHLVAAAGRPRAIVLLRSLDGGSTFEAAREVAPVRAAAYTVTPSICNRMALVHASIGIDRSPGEHRGNLYVTWSDYGTAAACGGGCDPANPCSASVFMSRSLDRGETWSAPILVHEPAAGTGDRYHQWAEVDPGTGHLFVVYNDTRDDPGRVSTHVYLSRSTDGGRSFERSIRLSSAASRASNGFQYGDYQGVDVADARVYGAWADFRSSSTSSRIFVGAVDFDPDVSARPSLLDFRTVRIGKAKKRRLRLTNRTVEPIELGRLTIPGSSVFTFAGARDRCSETTLAPGRSCRARIRFRPVDPGPAASELLVPSSSPGLPELRIRMLGIGLDDSD